MASYTLNFQWCGNVDRLPQLSGIYFVYRAKLNRDNNTADVKELIYIGQSENIYQRHHPHDRQADFDHQLQKADDILCYAYCEHQLGETLDLIENGLIFKRQPRLNNNYKDSFNHNDTQFVLMGSAHDIMKDFTVYNLQ